MLLGLYKVRRALRILAWTLGTLVAIPIVLVIAVLAVANIPAGQRQIAALVGRLTGGTVVAEGLSGRFPDDLHLRHLALRDADGAWLVIETLSLDWSPLRLASGVADIQDVRADAVHVLRLPASSATASSSSGAGFTLPVRVVLDHLQVTRLEVDAPVAGAQLVASASASGALNSLSDGHVTVALDAADGRGTYRLSGAIDPAHIKADLTASEPAHGMLAGLAKLPDLGPIALQAHVDGPRSAEATQVAITAGPLRAAVRGTVDVPGESAALDVTASAPAMAPRPDVSWQSVALDAHVHGTFTRPDATAHVRIDRLAAGGAAIEDFTAEFSGNSGRVALHAALDGLRLPGPKPDLLAATPLTLDADARLDQPDRPVDFDLRHRLLEAKGTALTGGDLRADVTLDLPELAPFAAIGGVDLQGRTHAVVHAAAHGQATEITVDGTAGVTGGMAPVPGLIGPNATIGVTATLDGQDITVSRAEVAGAALKLDAHGSDLGGDLALSYALSLPDLSVLAPSVAGRLDAQGTVQGQQTSLSLVTDLRGEVATAGFPRGPVQAHLQASGLPGTPSGTIAAQGTLDGAPLSLDAAVQRAADGTIHATVSRGDWRSAHLDADLTLPPGAKLPLGKAALRVTRLADLAPLVGQPLGGSVQATAQLGTGTAQIDVTADQVGLPSARVGKATLTAKVTDPLGNPSVAARLDASGIAAGAIGGSARVEVQGPQSALSVRLSAALQNLAGSDAQVTGAAVLDVPDKRVALDALQADWHGEQARLLGPTRIGFGDGVTVDRLRLGVRQAVLELAGRVSPTLDLTASLRNVTAELATPFAPSLAADGTIAAEARLGGTTVRPTGTVRVTAAGVRMRSGPARSLPVANLLATADLTGTAARLHARLTAGSTHLAVAGTAPLGAGALDLHATGAVDLAITDPILTPDGRRARGNVTLDATVLGTTTAPRISGSMRLAGGEVVDYVQGVHITGLTALVEATGDTIRLASLSGRAGPGTLSASGTVGLAAPMPVDLSLAMHNARPLDSALLSALLDAELTVRGQVQGTLAASGSILVHRADIAVPDKLPVSVATLNVIRPGQKPPPPAAPGPLIGLDITVNAPRAIFVRGRGLTAELGGRLHIGGTSTAPDPTGAFTMLNGQFSLVGQTLTFTSGSVSFDGNGVENHIDPTLNFEADSTSGGITAILKVTGYASAPKIALSSNPELPQDEVLAQLLFGQSAKSLGPFQYAEIAQALAQISGVGSPLGNDPLNAVRQGLGLDRLTVTGGSSTSTGTPTDSGPSVQGGRYVANGVYVGAKQGTSANAGTAAEVQIDLYKGLKLDTQVGSGEGGSNVGLTYQFEY